MAQWTCLTSSSLATGDWTGHHSLESVSKWIVLTSGKHLRKENWLFFFLSFVWFWECFGFVIAISKEFPQIRLHSASLSILGSNFDELLTVILLIADSFRKAGLHSVSCHLLKPNQEQMLNHHLSALWSKFLSASFLYAWHRTFIIQWQVTILELPSVYCRVACRRSHMWRGKTE